MVPNYFFGMVHLIVLCMLLPCGQTLPLFRHDTLNYLVRMGLLARVYYAAYERFYLLNPPNVFPSVVVFEKRKKLFIIKSH